VRGFAITLGIGVAVSFFSAVTVTRALLAGALRLRLGRNPTMYTQIHEEYALKPPKGSFDENAAARGKELFEGQAKCATCHVLPLFTEPGWNMHTPEEIGVDDFQANRAPDKRYRTAPLKGLWTHTKGGFYHDGRFATLGDVVHHYNSFFGLGLSDSQVHDVVEYLSSL